MPVLRLPRDVTVVAFAWVALQLLDVPRLTYYLRPFELERFLPDIMQFRYLHLGVALYVIFRLWPASRTQRFIGGIFGFLAAACALYSIASYETHAADIWSQTDLLVAAVGVLLLLESVRRVLGLPVALFVVWFLIGLAARSYQLDGIDGMAKMTTVLWFTTEGVFGYVMGLSAWAGFLFVLLGALIQQASAGKGVNRAVDRMLAAICGPQSQRIVFRAFRNRLLIWVLVALYLLVTVEGSFTLSNWTVAWLWKPAAYSQVLGFLLLFMALSLPFMRIIRFSDQPDTTLKALADALWLSAAAFVFGAVVVGPKFPAGTHVVWAFVIAIPAFLAWGWREDRRIDTSLTRWALPHDHEGGTSEPQPARATGFVAAALSRIETFVYALYKWWQPIFVRTVAAISGTATSALLLATAFLAASLLLAVNFGLTQLLWSNLPRTAPAPFIVVTGMAVAFGIIRIGLRRWRPMATGLTLHFLVWLIPIHAVFFAAFHVLVTAGSAAFYAVCTAAICLVAQRTAETRANTNRRGLGRRLARDTVCVMARSVTAAAMISVAAGAVGIVIWAGANLRN